MYKRQADKVMGRALYAGDLTAPGMLYGAAARSPYAHARLKSLEMTAALAMPGVAAALRAADIPVSYTHLDVYKRQITACLRSRRS